VGSSSEVSGWSKYRLALLAPLALNVFAGVFFLATVLSCTVLGFANRFFAGCCDIPASLFFDLVDFILVFFLVAIRAV